MDVFLEVTISWTFLQVCAPSVHWVLCLIVKWGYVCPPLVGVVGKKKETHTKKGKNADRPSMLRHEGIRMACVHPHRLAGPVNSILRFVAVLTSK